MSIEVETLDNGATIVVDPMPHVETVAFGTWIKAGSRNETEQQHGIAHLLEHMAFKGTKKRTARQIAETIENVGGGINAATSVETTSYYARMLHDDLPLGMDVLHDILTNSAFDEAELAREKHVVLQEIGAANDTPDDLVFDLFLDTAFGGQPLGRPIMGTPQTVKSFSSADIRNYLTAHYRGPNLVLSASGKIDADHYIKQAETLYAPFASELTEPAQKARYIGGQTLLTRPTEETQIVLGFEGKAYHARDFYASQLLSMILGGGMSSRLFQEVREKHGLCYSIYSFHWSFSDSGVFGVHAATQSDDLEKLFPVILDELKRASQDIAQQEVNRARAQIRASLMMGMERPASRAAQTARQIMLFGRPVTNEELMDRLDAISVERLRNLAAKLFSRSKPTIAAVGSIDQVMGYQQIADRLGIKLKPAKPAGKKAPLKM